MELERPACSTTLGSLSDELILFILGNFCSHCREGPHESQHAYFVATEKHLYEPSWYILDVSALRSMRLVSRRFCRLAQEILYHEFAPGQGGCKLDDWQSIGYSWFWCLELFLRTVALNPSRAAMVKKVHVNGNVLCCIVEDSYETRILKTAAQARGIDVSNFVASFEDQRPQVDPSPHPATGNMLLAMLLACLPHLKTLTFSWDIPIRSIPASALRAAGLSTLPIQTLGMTGCDRTLGLRLGGILDLASATIRNLHLND